MEIRQRIQNVGETVNIQGVGEVPTTIDRTANAKVAVRDQDTIILGGFISADASKSKSGVPYLKDLPALGFLFRASSSKRNRKELMVFIRPTVLPDPETAAKLAATERSKVSPVNAVERQFGIDEQERTETLLREMQEENDKNNKKKLKNRPAAPPPADNSGLQSFPTN
jgi:general secretion pathway protein D